MIVKGILKGCWRHQAAISLMAADRLPSSERAALAQHLAKCTTCAARVEQLTRVAEDLQRWADTATPVESNPGFQFALRKALRETAQASSAQQIQTPSCARSRFATNPVLGGALIAIWALILFFNLNTASTVRPATQSAQAPAREILFALKNQAQREYIARFVDKLSPTPTQPSSQPSQSHPPKRSDRENGSSVPTVQVEACPEIVT